MSTDEFHYLFQALVKHIRGIDPPEAGPFINRLHNKAKLSKSMRGSPDMAHHIKGAPIFPLDDPEPGSQLLDGINASVELARLANSTLGDVLSEVDPSLDKKKYRDNINVNNARRRYLEIITNLTTFCFAEVINWALQEQTQRTLHDLAIIPGFPEYVAEQVQKEHFIKVEIMVDTMKSNYLFSILMLLAVDLLVAKPAQLPWYSKEFQKNPSYQVLDTWSRTMWKLNGRQNTQSMDVITEFCGKVATGVFCSESDTGLVRPQPAYTIIQQVYELMLQGANREFYDNDDYTQAAKDSIKRLEHKKDVINEWQSYCSKFEGMWRKAAREKWRAGLNEALSDEDQDAVHNWIVDGDSYEQQGGVPQDLRIFNGHPGGYQQGISGFLAGTRILLNSGNMVSVNGLISESAEGCSVTVNHANVSLVGFNGEEPFTTCTQIFHSSTGLRAVDPATVKAFNPHLIVGKLCVGHVIYRSSRSKNGLPLEAVEIKSMTTTTIAPHTLYGVSLGEGNQSLHANDYLVAIIDANDHIKSLATSLKNVPAEQRMTLLASIPELKPLFATHDIQTLCERVNCELFGAPDPPNGCRASKAPPLLSHPSAIECANAVSKLRSLKPAPGVPLEKLNKTFQLNSIDSTRLPLAYRLPDVAVVDGFLVLDGHVQLQYSCSPSDRTFRWSRELPSQAMFEHGVFEVHERGISGRGSVLISSEPEPQAFSNDAIHYFEAVVAGRATTVALNAIQSAGDDDIYEEDFTFNMTFDKSVWPENEKRDKPKEPIDGGKLTLGSYTTPAKVTYAGATVPAVDELISKINSKFNKDLDSSPYRVFTDTWKDGTIRTTIELKNVSLIPFISDGDLDFDPLNVSFVGSLGIDTKVPILFQSLYFDSDELFETVTGALYEYDPNVRGMKGKRHLITGKSDDLQPMTKLRANISHTFARTFSPGTYSHSRPALHPATVTQSLPITAALSLDQIIKMEYNDNDVHSISQTFIQDMMLYHMDEDQRKNFTGRVQPPDLPQELAGGLPSELKGFFKNKYAPAFICNSISHLEKYKDKFSQKQRDRLWYWWQGQGVNCLSNSKEYSQINNRTSIAAIKYLYKKVLDPFFDDDPEKWALTLSNHLNRKSLIKHYFNNPIAGNMNVVNKLCTIMNTLAPDKQYAESWFEKIIAFGTSEQPYPCIDQDRPVAEQWIHDSMESLILHTLRGDGKLPADVERELQEDIQKFETENQLDQQKLAEERTRNIMTSQAVFLTKMTDWVTAIGKVMKLAFKGTTLFQWASKMFEEASTKVGSMKGVKYLKGAASICMVSYYFAQVAMNVVFLVKNWAELSDEQKAVLILESIQQVATGVSTAIEQWKKFKSNAQTTAEDRIDTEVLGEKVQNSIRENPEVIKELSEKLNKGEKMRDVISKRIATGEQPETGVSKQHWSEELDPKVTPKGTPVAEEEAASKFNYAGAALKVFTIIIGVAVAVALTFSLVHDWPDMTTAGKIINTLTLIIQVLSVIVDIVTFTAEVLIGTAVLCTALSIVGAVLAVVGIIVMIVSFFINQYKCKPPPDPIKDFLDSKYGLMLIDSFDEAPKIQLEYSASSDSVPAGSLNTISFEGVNNTKNTVELLFSRIQMTGGEDELCLFNNKQFNLVDDSSPEKESADHVYVTSSSLASANIIPTSVAYQKSYWQYQLKATGPKKGEQNVLQKLILKPAEKFKSVWTATVNGAGSSEIEIVEKTATDQMHVVLSVKRF